MKKIVFLTLLLCLVTVGSVSAEDLYCPNPGADQLGVTIHYSPTDFQFTKGVGGTDGTWTYDQDIASLGLYALVHFNGLALVAKNRLLLGASENSDSIGIVGDKTELRLSASEVLVFTYSYTTYFPNDMVSPIYQMCVADIHRLGIDINVPIFQSSQKY